MNKGEFAPEHCRSVDDSSLRFCFRRRERRSNKGDFGAALCVCGSDGMGGAAILSARAAYRVGAGIVRIFTHRENYAPTLSALPEAVMVTYRDGDIRGLLASVAWADSVLVGCGLGIGEISRDILRGVLENIHSPLVIDADALNILSKEPMLWECLSKEQREQTVITPHMMEMSRLTGEPIEDILAEPERYAINLSRTLGVTVVLKDHRTVVTNGEVVYINHSGNPGMSTAGAGDVLAGILCGMLGQSGLECDSFIHKVALGVYLHGRAGDMAAQKLGEYSVMASDICKYISDVIKNV